MEWKRLNWDTCIKLNEMKKKQNAWNQPNAKRLSFRKYHLRVVPRANLPHSFSSIKCYMTCTCESIAANWVENGKWKGIASKGNMAQTNLMLDMATILLTRYYKNITRFDGLLSNMVWYHQRHATRFAVSIQPIRSFVHLFVSILFIPFFFVHMSFIWKPATCLRTFILLAIGIG